MDRYRKFTMSAMLVVFAVVSVAAGFFTIRTRLDGSFEVPVRSTDAKGNAVLRIKNDESEIHYKLVVNTIDNVFMAHIHMGAEGTNGPIVVWLYPQTPNPPSPTPPESWIPGRSNGKLAQGVITADDLVGPLAGQSLSVLIQALKDGNLYVNVHTNDFADPTNTGPGDFPGGEIRGQIHVH